MSSINLREPIANIRRDELTALCSRLTYAVERTGLRALLAAGIWRLDPRDDAPESFAAVVASVTEARVSGWLPVSNQQPASTVYTRPSVNLTFRAWHDLTHVQVGGDFSYRGEVITALRQMQQLREFLRSPDADSRGRSFGDTESLLRLFLIDTIGQAEFYRRTGGGFVSDQLAFAWDCLTLGLDIAILRETACQGFTAMVEV